MRLTNILKMKGSWEDVVDDCRNTVSKPPLGHDPSDKFKTGILISEHSPIRDITVRWKWNNMKSWIATHWSRHKFEKYISTQRSDRTGVDRDNLPQSATVSFVGEANTQQLIDVFRKRLCRQSARETREYAIDFKRELYSVEPEIASVLVPNCIYRCGCPEMNRCSSWKRFVSAIKQKDMSLNYMSIEDRYEFYNNVIGFEEY